MEMIAIAPTEVSFVSAAVEPLWINVVERMPKDGELVHVLLEHSRDIRLASRGDYQSTSAWFDAQTHSPIYETIIHWKPRSQRQWP
jgi:hypothetical protein